MMSKPDEAKEAIGFLKWSMVLAVIRTCRNHGARFSIRSTEEGPSLLVITTHKKFLANAIARVAGPPARQHVDDYGFYYLEYLYWREQ